MSSRMACRWDICLCFLSNWCKNVERIFIIQNKCLWEKEDDHLSFSLISTFHEKKTKTVKVFRKKTFSGVYTILKTIFNCFSFSKSYLIKNKSWNWHMKKCLVWKLATTWLCWLIEKTIFDQNFCNYGA